MDRHDPKDLDDLQLARFFEAMAEEREDEAVDSGAADAVLRELLAGLPRPLPRPGFAERAALAAAMAGTPAMPERRAVLAARWRRVLLAACLAATACGVALLPWVVGVAQLALGRFRLAGAAALPARLAALVLGGLGAAAADLSSLAVPVLGLQRALADAVARPGGAAVAGLCLLISALALRFLHDLVERERSWNHVHPIH